MRSEHWNRPVRARLHVLIRFLYDCVRYMKHSCSVHSPVSTAQRHAAIMKAAHVIEKGLALPEPRLNFGEAKLRDLCDWLLCEPDTLSTAFRMGVNAVRSYIEFHEARGAEVAAFIPAALAQLDAKAEIPFTRSVAEIRLTELKSRLNQSPEAFLLSRRSVRQFSDDPVDASKLLRAAEIAQACPSVCNRQSGRIHFITERDQIDAALRYQSGNRGFGHTISALAIITVELGAFLEPNERNQPFVDGGLFAMQFLLGLHAQGLGACPLNWSRNPRTDVQFRRHFNMPESEEIIVMVGIGNLRERFEVALSPRIPVDSYVFFKN